MIVCREIQTGSSPEQNIKLITSLFKQKVSFISNFQHSDNQTKIIPGTFCCWGGGGGNSNLFYTGVCHFGRKYSTYKSGSTSKKDTHKSGKQKPRKALTTVSSMSKAGKIILRQFFSKVYL